MSMALFAPRRRRVSTDGTMWQMTYGRAETRGKVVERTKNWSRLIPRGDDGER